MKQSSEQQAALPPLEEASLPPDPHPIVRRLKPPLSTAGSRRLNVPRRSSSSVPGCSPLPVPGRGGTGSFLFLSPRLLPPLGGRMQQAASSSSLRHRQFSGLALKGGPESFLFLALTGGSFASPRPPSDRSAGQRPASLHCGFSPASRSLRALVVSSLGSPAGRPRELPPQPAASLAGSRWQDPASWILFSFVVPAFPRLALGRAAERACSSSLSGGVRQSRTPMELALACLPVTHLSRLPASGEAAICVPPLAAAGSQ